MKKKLTRKDDKARDKSFTLSCKFKKHFLKKTHAIGLVLFRWITAIWDKNPTQFSCRINEGKRKEMKNKKNLCKKTKIGHKLWIKFHYAKFKSLFQKTFNTTSGQVSTNPNHCLFKKVKTKTEKNRKKVRD